MGLFVPEDFVAVAARAMLQLKISGRSNILYNLAKAIGTQVSHKVDTNGPGRVHCKFSMADNLQSVSQVHSLQNTLLLDA